MENRIALVTGAGRGIGRAIAAGLAAEGARVAVTARSVDELENLAREVRDGGGEALVVPDDLSDRSAPARIVRTVAEGWGPVEILVNNAGVGSSQNPKPLVDFDDDFWDLTLMINLTAPYLFTRLVLPSMMERGWGRIINISSIAGRIGSEHGAAYGVSKHGLLGLTRSTAVEAATHGITANAVCPGVTRSRLNDRRLEYDSERLGVSFEQLERESTPLGRRLEPEEVAILAVQLARDEARGINGQCINVCGGRVFS
ncbi:MAG: SDR family NAD(P)-dependent oxidoreductase [Candidatus Aminicenantes bacterium]|nr:SDR family NAD(P)-dependent oxidoreductase [Candidatus Aminicenantes bacterium]